MLIIESLERYDFFYGDSFLVECPTGSGKKMRLKEVSIELARRLGKLFLKDSTGRRPCHGNDSRYRDDENWKDLILFYEFFDAEDGRGCGARYVIMKKTRNYLLHSYSQVSNKCPTLIDFSIFPDPLPY